MAYKQNFGRNNLTNLNIAALTNGGTDPETDPVKPFKPVAGEFNEELDEITIKAPSKAKKERDAAPSDTAPGDREIISQYGPQNFREGTIDDGSYTNFSDNVNRTTRQVVNNASGATTNITDYSHANLPPTRTMSNSFSNTNLNSSEQRNDWRTTYNQQHTSNSKGGLSEFIREYSPLPVVTPRNMQDTYVQVVGTPKTNSKPASWEQKLLRYTKDGKQVFKNGLPVIENKGEKNRFGESFANNANDSIFKRTSRLSGQMYNEQQKDYLKEAQRYVPGLTTGKNN